MPGIVVNTQGMTRQVEDGDYTVALTSVKGKTTQRGDDMITIGMTIRESDSVFNGRQVFRNFVFSNDPEKADTRMMTIGFMLDALMAFGGDSDDMESESFDPETYGKSLVGNKAKATITQRRSDSDDRVFLDIRLSDLDL